MSGFGNAILGGAANLIRKAIQSPNYVPGNSGWSVNKDGSAEFTNGVFRGTLQAGSISGTPIGGAVITGSDFQGGTMEETIITLDSSGGVVLLYATTVATVTLAGSGNWTAPAGLQGGTVKVQAIGAGEGGSGGGVTGAGGAGEYAQESTLAVTPGNAYAYAVGAAGTAGAAGLRGGAGGSTTFHGDSVTVTAHGGGQQGAGIGGQGSSNSIHFPGGSGGPSSPFGDAGSGGGSSAGPAAGGNNGHSFSGSTGGTGGSAVSGGGAGGRGADVGGLATAGAAPGGGGGAGWSAPGAGAAGGAGSLKLTWVTAQTLIGSFAPVAGVDPMGNAYPAGAMAPVLTLPDQAISPTAQAAAAQLYTPVNGQPQYQNAQGFAAYLSAALSAATSTITAASTISPVTLVTYAIPASDVVAGAVHVIEAAGVYSTAATAGTLKWDIQYNGVSLAGGGFSPVLPNGVTGLAWHLKALVCWVSATEAYVLTEIRISQVSATSPANTYMRTSDVTGLVTTGAANLTLVVTWGTASASNTITRQVSIRARLA